MVLVAGDRFVGIEEDAAGLRPGGEFALVDARGRQALADLQELRRIFRMGGVVSLLIGDEFLERRTLAGFDLATDRKAEGEGEALVGGTGQEAGGERASFAWKAAMPGALESAVFVAQPAQDVSPSCSWRCMGAGTHASPSINVFRKPHRTQWQRILISHWQSF
jgi:hypothetical protein